MFYSLDSKYAAFGEYIVGEYNGRFVDGGFIYYEGSEDLQKILEEIEDEDQPMNFEEM